MTGHEEDRVTEFRGGVQMGSVMGAVSNGFFDDVTLTFSSIPAQVRVRSVSKNSSKVEVSSEDFIYQSLLDKKLLTEYQTISKLNTLDSSLVLYFSLLIGQIKFQCQLSWAGSRTGSEQLFAVLICIIFNNCDCMKYD